MCLTLYSRDFGMQVVGDKAVIFGGCGVTKSNEPCVSNQTYYLHMSSDPMKWEEADLMGDVPPPRWRHTATLLPDGVRSAPPSPRCSCRPDAIHPLLHLCLPAAFAHVAGQHHDVRWALQGQACRRPHSSHPPRPHRPHRPVRPRHPPRPCAPRCTGSPRMLSPLGVQALQRRARALCREERVVDQGVRRLAAAAALARPRVQTPASLRELGSSLAAAWRPRACPPPPPPPPPPCPCPQLGAGRPWP